nr:PREDICTED: THAP domain-containing protein 5 isoform X2 [Latimeria chalumnae]XP_014349968.1 PREDICTED: THAP domain-containing protein 5 isoform X2 [Latimeria chalumnae]|eukprot:XP_006005941.1 PREDICTED: THAP domain-containing protein 5 isoform X2 [Latimeria chalumnae]
MKRDNWIPSKHQFLCSDHFTSDSFDVRWGIRYLKHNAIPTIFSFPEGAKEKDFSSHPSRKKRGDSEDKIYGNVEKSNSESERPCPAKKKTVSVMGADDAKEESKLSRCIRKKKVVYQEPAVLQNKVACSEKLDGNNILQKNVAFRTDTESFQTPVQNNSDKGSFGTELEKSSEKWNCIISVASTIDQSTEKLGVDVPVSSGQFDENTLSCRHIVETIEQFNEPDDSVITFIVPCEYSEETAESAGSIVSIDKLLRGVEQMDNDVSCCTEQATGTEVLQTEHAYCRQDTDRDDLWHKIAKLHAKITLLELQEEKTIARLKSLETLIGQLKQENLISEEKLKIVENCFTTFEVTMIQ